MWSNYNGTGSGSHSPQTRTNKTGVQIDKKRNIDRPLAHWYDDIARLPNAFPWAISLDILFWRHKATKELRNSFHKPRLVLSVPSSTPAAV